MSTVKDPVIEVENLEKVFDNSVRAVDGITFQVGQGEIFGFLGPNGAGKTTTISILTTLTLPTSGRAEVFGNDVVSKAAVVRELIGLVPQELTVDDELTGRENMELQADLYHVPRGTAKTRIDELLALIGLKDSQDRYVKTYSGGMRKRLELAEGLIHRPKVLFLDEPTLGLDVQTRTVIWEHIRRLKKETNMTIFVTTHYLEEADNLCDRIAIIDRGKIVALDTPDALKRAVGGDIIEIEVSECKDDFLERVLSVPDVSLLDHKCEGNKARLKVRDSNSALPAILEALWRAKISVKAVSIKKPSLDQAFLEFTGRELRDADTVAQGGGFDKRATAYQMSRRR